MKTSITFYLNTHKKRENLRRALYMRVQLGKTKAEPRLHADLSDHELLLRDDWKEFFFGIVEERQNT
jgi:hypothetical protein